MGCPASYPLFAVIGIGMIACSSPAERFEQEAIRLSLRSETYRGSPFLHMLYRRERLQGPAQSQSLHVYLGSDGTPMRAGFPAGDPTPRNPLALRLLALDPDPAIYLGRPCYHGLARSSGCSSEYWTSARYSEEVVASLAAAVRRFAEANGFEKISWFGYSGGGTLAVLLAQRFAETQSVVTVAANLDTQSWTEHHGYAPLTRSLNPASRRPLPNHVVQRHYFGGRDEVVPAHVTARSLVDSSESLTVFVNYDHVCCWQQAWPRILVELVLQIEAQAKSDGVTVVDAVPNQSPKLNGRPDAVR
jgi:hypothetical protein